MQSPPWPLAATSTALLLSGALLAVSLPTTAIENAPSNAQSIGSPMPAEEAARTMIVPEGFHVTVFAAEPDVAQPIGFCFDDRGRLWVAENYGYPVHSDKPGKDRILIFEDTDGDGRHDVRKVFYEGFNYVTGIEYGFGGAWVMSPPYFYFIPDRNVDDIPDGKPEVLLDGFGNHANAHNLASALAWGPDGWLYGTHGRTNWSMVGKPGTPEKDRKRFDGGVYRYHPVRREWEAYCDGMTNPWGIDWNDYGHAFVCNCVDPHLFEVIQGAHYEPWRNRESSKYAYERIATIADHRHFISQHNVRDGLGTPEEDTAGGGHAHCGTMVYLGDNWPAEYRNQIFMNNIHGKRINCDIPKRQGSGYTASHGKDVMRNRDDWFMGVTLAYGPDGGVYVIDWSDTGECHSTKNTQRQTGRIYKITYGQPKPQKINLSQLSKDELVKLQLHENDWYVRHARRLLQERAAMPVDVRLATIGLKKIFDENPDVKKRLRALWTLHAMSDIHSLGDEFLRRCLSDPDEHIRAWAIQFACEKHLPSQYAMVQFAVMASRDLSQLVRRNLASAAIRHRGQHFRYVIASLAQRSEDCDDPNLPLLIWYAALRHGGPGDGWFLELVSKSTIPFIQRSVARRAVSTDAPEADLDALLQYIQQGANRTEILRGILLGLEDHPRIKPPARWQAVFDAILKEENAETQMLAVKLALKFGDAGARDSLAKIAADKSALAKSRIEAVETLLSGRFDDLRSLLIPLLDDSVVAGAAIRGLARDDHAETAKILLSKYTSFDSSAKQDAIQTLSSRKEWAAALLDAIEKKQGVEKSELSAYAARQIASLGDAKLTAQLQRVWGEIRPSVTERAKQIADLKRRLTPNVIEKANRIAGKATFKKECATCHRFFGDGPKNNAAIGPELTGAQRTNLDYLLENIIDPSAAISRDFQMEVIETDDGRVISGLVAGESNASVTIQSVNEKIVIPKPDIASRQKSAQSMMPEGIAQKLTFEQLRDLIAYLSSPGPLAP